MGPHFFKCGKLECGDTQLPPEAPFNGAALFQVRKVGNSGHEVAYIMHTFNGAALFQVRKAYVK